MNYKDKGPLEVIDEASFCACRVIVEILKVSIGNRIAIIVQEIIGHHSKGSVVIPDYFGYVFYPEYPKGAVGGRETPVGSILNKR